MTPSFARRVREGWDWFFVPRLVSYPLRGGVETSIPRLWDPAKMKSSGESKLCTVCARHGILLNVISSRQNRLIGWIEKLALSLWVPHILHKDHAKVGSAEVKQKRLWEWGLNTRGNIVNCHMENCWHGKIGSNKAAQKNASRHTTSYWPTLTSALLSWRGDGNRAYLEARHISEGRQLNSGIWDLGQTDGGNI